MTQDKEEKTAAEILEEDRAFEFIITGVNPKIEKAKNFVWTDIALIVFFTGAVITFYLITILIWIKKKIKIRKHYEQIAEREKKFQEDQKKGEFKQEKIMNLLPQEKIKSTITKEKKKKKIS